MTTGKALNGKPYAGNPHVRFDEGEVAPAAKPRRGSLLYSKMNVLMMGGTGSGTPRQAWLNYHDERNMNHKQTEM